jgi:hypothetical protein
MTSRPDPCCDFIFRPNCFRSAMKMEGGPPGASSATAVRDEYDKCARLLLRSSSILLSRAGVLYYLVLYYLNDDDSRHFVRQINVNSRTGMHFTAQTTSDFNLPHKTG